MSDITVRIDKWLWAARFYKTRSMAAEAVNGGKVHLNGVRTKPSKFIKVGAEIRVRKTGWEQTVVVLDLSEKRGSAKEAQKLYQETEKSLAENEKRRQIMKSQPQIHVEPGKPSKKDRRQLQRAKRHI